MTAWEVAVVLTIPPASTRAVEWWRDRAVRVLDDLARAQGRRLHGRARWKVTHGEIATMAACCQTRPLP